MALGHIQSCCKWSWLTSTSWLHHSSTFLSIAPRYLLSFDLQGTYLEVVPHNSLQTCFPPAGNSLISTQLRNTAHENALCAAGFHLRIFFLHIRTISYKRSKYMLFSPFRFSNRYTRPPAVTHQLCLICISLELNHSSAKWKNTVFR